MNELDDVRFWPDIDEEDLDSVRRAGYASEDYEYWQFGQCATYARALMQMKPSLKFGAMGVGSGEHKYPTHYFAHDDRHAYDSAGRHPLPYHGITHHADYSELDQDPHDPRVPLDACEQDITEAQDHARRNGILEGRHQRQAMPATAGQTSDGMRWVTAAAEELPPDPGTAAIPEGQIRLASGNVKEPNDARVDAGGLRIARGLWYRLHRSDQLDLDPGRARSRPLDHGGPGQAGLSAFARPHHLLHYATELTWGSRRETPYLPEDRGVLRRVVAFHGREIGRGDDDEPLVRPEPDSSCCGRIVHEHMAWSTFVRKLSDTPKPSARWTLDQAQEKGRRRVSAGRGRQAASRRRVTGMAGAVEQSRPRRVP